MSDRADVCTTKRRGGAAAGERGEPLAMSQRAIEAAVAHGWASACEAAKAGDPRRLALMLRAGSVAVPASARELLADLIEGRVVPKKKRGIKPTLSPAQIKMIRAAVNEAPDLIFVLLAPKWHATPALIREGLAREFHVSEKTIGEILAKAPRHRYSAK